MSRPPTALVATPLAGLPLLQPGDDVSACITAALAAAGMTLGDGDIVVVTSKALSRVEGRFVELSAVTPGEAARSLAAATGKDPRVVELILRESVAVSRAWPGGLVTRHRLGFVAANAGIDASNAGPPAGAPAGEWVLLLPVDPDGSARRLRASLQAAHGCRLAVVVTDSHGRPFRVGTVGVAVGAAGLPALRDQRGQPDLLGRTLEHTITALADQVAALADLAGGQAAEGTPVVIVRGVAGVTAEDGPGAATLHRDPAQDRYA